MNIRLIVAAILVCGIWTIAPSQSMAQSKKSKANSQSDTLSRAKEISAISGRPIFAVAGQST